MQRLVKLSSVVLAILLVAVALTSCGVSKNDVVGEWTRSYYAGGSYYLKTIELKADGTYIQTMIKDEVEIENITGTYEIKNSRIHLYDSNSQTAVYEYEDGLLAADNYYYSKT